VQQLVKQCAHSCATPLTCWSTERCQLEWWLHFYSLIVWSVLSSRSNILVPDKVSLNIRLYIKHNDRSKSDFTKCRPTKSEIWTWCYLCCRVCLFVFFVCFLLRQELCSTLSISLRSWNGGYWRRYPGVTRRWTSSTGSCNSSAVGS